VRHIQALQTEFELELDDSSFVRVARRWLEQGLGLAPGTVTAVQRRESGWISSFVVGDPLGESTRIEPFDHDRFVDALDLVGQRRTEASLDMEWSDPSAEAQVDPVSGELSVPMPSGPFNFFRLQVAQPMPDDASWVRLTAAAGVNTVYTGDPGDDLVGENFGYALARRWPEIVGNIVGEVPIAFGAITPDRRYPSDALDHALRRHTDESRVESGQYLRGYAWVTVCPRALAWRLGGAPGLSRSGAFFKVQELPSGDVLLQATDLPHQFDREALRVVWSALAPVLPPGIPTEGPLDAYPLELVMEDAAASPR
jgi:hypothetical protein